MKTIVICTAVVLCAALTSAMLVPTEGELGKTDKARARAHLQKLGFAASTKLSARKKKWAAEIAAAFAEIDRRHQNRRVAQAGSGSGSQCCSKEVAKVGDFCCGNDETCCTDTCCQNGQGLQKEECCPDKVNGGVCCITQETKCCPPNPARDLPSHCCPNWYICCDHGRYGCCDPDTMLPMESNEFYSIIQETNWLTDGASLYGYTVDAANATLGNKVKLPHEYHVNGEIPRSFMFSKTTGNFYILQANMTVNAAPGPNPDRAIHLFSINPRTGSIQKTKVTGAYDQVTGYHYVDEIEKILISTPVYSPKGTTGNQTRIGYNFYHVDPATAVATAISFYDSTQNEEYAGWFHEVSADGKTAYRLGYQHVTTSTNFGVEITNLTVTPATTKFVLLSPPTNYTHFRSINKLPGGTDSNPSFVSLAGSYEVADFGDLAVFTWTLDSETPSSIKKVGSFKNAHRSPYFGPIQEAISPDGKTYAAMVNQKSPLGSNSDTWAFGMVNLATGAVVENAISPWLLSTTNAVAGLGITHDSQIWQKKF